MTGSQPVSGRVLGIDPGLSRCGVAVLDGSRRAPALHHAGVLRTGADEPVGGRLAQVRGELAALLDRCRPAVVAVERVLFNANVRTAMGVAQAAGVALLAAAEAGVAAVEYTPSQVKATVAGTGDADKRQVGLMVATALGLSRAPTPADAADAVAVALCHLQRHAAGALAAGSGATAATPGNAEGGRIARAAAQAQPGAPVVVARGEVARPDQQERR